jgi:hypothetical protein
MPRIQISTDRRVLDILDTINAKGMNLGSFLEAYFHSNNHRIKSRVGWFFKQGWMRRVFRAMVKSSKFAANKRATATATAEISDTITEDMVRLVLRILRDEMKAVGKDKRSRVDPAMLTPIACADFDLKEVQRLYEDKAPTLWKLVRILTGVAGLQPEEDVQEDDDLDDAGPGDEEDEEHGNGPEAGIPGELPDEVPENDWEDIDIGELDIYVPEPGTGQNRSNWVTEEDLEELIQARDASATRKGRKHRVLKDRTLMATTALAIMLYGRSRWNNTIQVSDECAEFFSMQSMT